MSAPSGVDFTVTVAAESAVALAVVAATGVTNVLGGTGLTADEVDTSSAAAADGFEGLRWKSVTMASQASLTEFPGCEWSR
jgi:dihydrodipicolinate reductase